MPETMPSNPLTTRLAALRRRLRYVTTIRGICRFLVVVLIGCIAAGLLDWRLHLPGPVRAFFLTALLGGAGVIVYRFLLRPLSAPADDLSLALRIEARYPELNDCLASTVQFLEQPAEVERSASGTLRKAAVDVALWQSEHCNFNQIIDGRGVRSWGLYMAGAGAMAVALVLLKPDVASTALLRLAQPFGSLEWPLQTRLTLDPATRLRIARNEPFEIRASLEGVIPEKAIVRFRFDNNSPPSEQSYPIAHKDNAPSATMIARRDASQVQKTFRFQVVANDAITPWVEVNVLPPPSLIPLDGRPSPLTRLRFPAYTDLPPADLADGTSRIEAVFGTHVNLRAAVDRHVSAAWIEYHPDNPSTRVTTALAMLGARNCGDAVLLAGVNESTNGKIPALITPYRSSHALEFNFTPWQSGIHALRLADEGGINGIRLFDVRLFPDPAPSVTLERPSASLDSLAVLPTATITVRVVVDDTQYAVRSAWIEHRLKDGKPTRRPLYDHQTMGTLVPLVQTVLSRSPVPIPPLRLRWDRLQLAQRFSLSEIWHPERRPLREGDVVILQACADDFDDVTANKQPGRSHEVELRIVGLPALEALLHHGQAQIQQELQRLREQERKAQKLVDAAEKQWRNTENLRPEDINNLVEAGQIQQEIRGRIGTKEEGLRAEVARIQQTLKDNNLPRSGTHERMDMVAEELERLAREEMEPIESLLTGARKENEQAADSARPEKRARGALTQAVQHQEEVERTLSDMLARLDAFSSGRQARAEAKAMLQDQRRVTQETDKLAKDTPAGRSPQELTGPQKAELDKAAEAQDRLADHAAELLKKMSRMAEEKNRQAEEKQTQAKAKLQLEEEKKEQAQKERDANPAQAKKLEEEAAALHREAEADQEAAQTLQDEAKTLEAAAQKGRQGNLDKTMKQAAESVGSNKLGKAGTEQQASAKTLEQMAKSLEDRREEELDKLVRKMKQAEKELAKLVEDQEKLQKRVRDAKNIEDPKKREEELQRLSREQEKLRRETREMAQQLTRMRAGQAGQDLREAGGQMDEAGQQLERGDRAEEQQDEALERLRDAQEELQDVREKIEEELAREKLLKIAEQLKLLKERQEALLPETERIHRDALQKKKWESALLKSLNRHAEAQKGLGAETQTLIEGKLAHSPVFARLLKKSADAMEQAAGSMSQRVKSHVENPDARLDLAAEQVAQEKTVKLQRDALQYIVQLLEALKTEEGLALRRPQKQGEGGGDMGGGGGKSGPEADGIPQMAELKVLKSLQEDVNKRTEAFSRKHPDSAKLTEQQKAELDTIRKDQTDISELLEKVAGPEQPEGAKP